MSAVSQVNDAASLDAQPASAGASTWRALKFGSHVVKMGSAAAEIFDIAKMIIEKIGEFLDWLDGLGP